MRQCKNLRNKTFFLQESLDSYKLQSKDIEEPSGSLQIGFKSAWTDLIRSKPDYRYYSLRSAKFSPTYFLIFGFILTNLT